MGIKTMTGLDVTACSFLHRY